MDYGATIVRSFELVENVWTQVQDLANSLARMTESVIIGGKLVNLRSAGAASFPRDVTNSGTSRKRYAISVPMTSSRRGKAVPTAWINYQIDLFGSGIPPRCGAGEESIGPVLHVSFWEMATDFTDPGWYVDFPPSWAECQIKDARLLYWDEETTNSFAQWTFSVRLLDLDSEDTVHSSVIKPVCALINGAAAEASVAEALPEAIRGLVCYASEDDSDEVQNLVVIDRAAR